MVSCPEAVGDVGSAASAREPKRGQQPQPVVRVVCVSAHPAVARLPEPRELGEALNRLTVEFHQPVTAEGGTNLASVDDDSWARATAHVRQFRGGDRGGRDSAERQFADRVPGGQHIGPGDLHR